MHNLWILNLKILITSFFYAQNALLNCLGCCWTLSENALHPNVIEYAEYPAGGSGSSGRDLGAGRGFCFLCFPAAEWTGVLSFSALEQSTQYLIPYRKDRKGLQFGEIDFDYQGAKTANGHHLISEIHDWLACFISSLFSWSKLSVSWWMFFI